MIVPMKLVTLLCLEQDRADAVSHLADLALMQLCRIPTPTTQNVASITARLNDCERVLGAIRSAPAIKKAPAAPAIPDNQITAYAQDLIAARAAAYKEMEQFERDAAALTPWGSFDRAALASLREKGILVTLCATPRNLFDQRKKADAFPDNAVLCVIHSDKNMVHYALVSQAAPNGDAFDPVALPEISVEDAVSGISNRSKKIADADLALSAAKVFMPKLEAQLSALREQLEFADACDGMSQAGRLAYLRGYVPVTRIDALKAAAIQNGWALLLEDPAEDDQDVPTYIEKPKFLNVLDPLFDFVGISPGYRENDVYLFFFFFFPIFFGMILGDAGYGTLMLTIGIVCRIIFRKAEKAKMPLALLIFLASFTLIWGWLNGSWFGLPKSILPSWMTGWSMITDPQNSPTAYKFVSFYGVDLSKMNESEQNIFWSGFPSKLTQYFCFFLAMLHLMSAHITRFFMGIRKDWREISNIGWAMMIFANFLLAVGLIVFSGTFPSWGVYIYIAAVAIIVITIRPAQALNLPFDLIGSFTDVLSYIRLFAVGLSGMYIAEKFNEMGLMVMHALPDRLVAIGFVLLVLVALAGHVLNLALGFLGVLVHAVRLNTLEFSNHMGLQWAGFKFKPFTAKQNNN